MDTEAAMEDVAVGQQMAGGTSAAYQSILPAYRPHTLPVCTTYLCECAARARQVVPP